MPPRSGLAIPPGTAGRGRARAPPGRASAPRARHPPSPNGGPSAPARRAGCSGRSRTRGRLPPSPRGCRPWSRRTSGPRAARSTAAPGTRATRPPSPRAGRRRRGTARYACEFEVAHPAAVLPAHAVLVGPDVPVGDFGTVRAAILRFTICFHSALCYFGISLNA